MQYYPNLWRQRTRPWANVRRSLRDNMFSRFDRTPACDEQTDRQRAVARSRAVTVKQCNRGNARGMPITACTVVQAVVKATSQSNRKGQILTPWGSENPERISMKLGIYNRVAGMATHANPCGAATSWVV